MSTWLHFDYANVLKVNLRRDDVGESTFAYILALRLTLSITSCASGCYIASTLMMRHAALITELVSIDCVNLYDPVYE